jgi:hypothetical protein
MRSPRNTNPLAVPSRSMSTNHVGMHELCLRAELSREGAPGLVGHVGDDNARPGSHEPSNSCGPEPAGATYDDCT